MSGKTTTLYTLSAQAPSAPPEGRHVAPPGTTLTFARAARELRLRRTEFDLAVDLGRIRTVPGEKDGNGGRRVAQEEIERLRADEDSPRTCGSGCAPSAPRRAPN